MTAEMDFLRRAVRKSRKEKIGNMGIREIINVQHNIDVIEERLLRWFGHLKRMGSKRILEII